MVKIDLSDGHRCATIKKINCTVISPATSMGGCRACVRHGRRKAAQHSIGRVTVQSELDRVIKDQWTGTVSADVRDAQRGRPVRSILSGPISDSPRTLWAFDRREFAVVLYTLRVHCLAVPGVGSNFVTPYPAFNGSVDGVRTGTGIVPSVRSSSHVEPCVHPECIRWRSRLHPSLRLSKG